MTPQTKQALLPCEGQCSRATTHTFDAELSSVPRMNGVGKYYVHFFRCSDCRQRRIWGNSVG